MASIRKKGSRYEARITIERKTTSRSFDTHAQARKWAAGIESGLAMPPAPPPITAEPAETSATVALLDRAPPPIVELIASPAMDVPTLAQACERYGREVSALHKGAKQELQRLSEFRRLAIAEKSIVDVSSDDIKRLRDSELARGLSGSTVRLKLSLLSAIFKHANSEWQIDCNNPVAKIRKPAAGRGRLRRLTDSEIDRLTASLDACHKPSMKALVLFAIETGMRRSEMLTMTWSVVNLERGVIALADTKNGQPRWIPLTPRAREILKMQQKVSRPFPITESAAAQSWQHIVKRAQIDDLRFHDLRHEALSRWAHRLGGDVFKLSLVSGHRTLSMAQRYVHPVISELIAASQINLS